MKQKFSNVLVAIIATAIIGFSASWSVQAEEESALARGGQLYDKWYKVIGVDAPKKSHPAYPADKKYAAKPKANWRCKECHGWDGKGVDGAYASGKHSTGIKGINGMAGGIKGINGMAGADPAKIIAVLKGNTHGYAGKMEDQDFQDLALFVSKGQVDMSKFIDYASKSPKGGNADQGAAYFWKKRWVSRWAIHRKSCIRS